ncbi:MAG: hypothetical protein LBP65_01920 [Puniceicoccales bacterium]|jgi:hypothetical protein|nr:hypothetical protein [Puniceicoccales bacterium]
MEVQSPLELKNVSTAPAAPPTGSLTVYAADGKLCAQDPSGSVVTLGERFYQTVLDEDGTAAPQRQRIKFEDLAVSDDPISGATVVTGPSLDRAVVAFAAADFVGDALTILPEAIPFSYTNLIIRVVKDDGEDVLTGVRVDPTDQTITITAAPFDGMLLVIKA